MMSSFSLRVKLVESADPMVALLMPSDESKPDETS